jgi:MOSC domain-containing protein YiiM
VFQGTLVAIYVSPRAAAPMTSVPRVQAVAGRGLEGDRYFAEAGTFSKPREPDAQVTLIEEEAVEAVACETKTPLSPAQTRRNLVTRGAPLNHLVGTEFTIGPVRRKGHGLCEPCSHLEALTRPGIKKDLLHRAGLRAEILEGGVLEPGQTLRAE